LIFTNGNFDKELSHLNAINGADFESEAAADEAFSKIFKANMGSLGDRKQNGFTAVNAFLREGAFIYLPKNARIEAPIQLLFITDEGKIAFPRVLIVAKRFRSDDYRNFVRRRIEISNEPSSKISVADEAKINITACSAKRTSFHVSTTAAKFIAVRFMTRRR
jgi:Fe-S cluster assembly scaffold protein SufB